MKISTMNFRSLASTIKGIVSLYKGRVLLFLKTFEINRKT